MLRGRRLCEGADRWTRKRRRKDTPKGVGGRGRGSKGSSSIGGYARTTRLWKSSGTVTLPTMGLTRAGVGLPDFLIARVSEFGSARRPAVETRTRGSHTPETFFTPHAQHPLGVTAPGPVAQCAPRPYPPHVRAQSSGQHRYACPCGLPARYRGRRRVRERDYRRPRKDRVLRGRCPAHGHHHEDGTGTSCSGVAEEAHQCVHIAHYTLTHTHRSVFCPRLTPPYIDHYTLYTLTHTHTHTHTQTDPSSVLVSPLLPQHTPSGLLPLPSPSGTPPKTNGQTRLRWSLARLSRHSASAPTCTPAPCPWLPCTRPLPQIPVASRGTAASARTPTTMRVLSSAASVSRQNRVASKSSRGRRGRHR